MIRKLSLEDSSYKPGEVLTHKPSEYTHITITYDVSGDRYLVDQSIEDAIEKDNHLVKVPYVNTTLYWQVHLGDSDWGDENLDDTTVSVFCMVGNLRAFAFKLY